MATEGIGTNGRVSPLDRERIAHIEVGHTDVSPALARGLVLWFTLMLAALPIIEAAGARAPVDVRPSSAWAHLTGLPAAIGARLAALEAAGPDPSVWTRTIAANRVVLAGLSSFETALEDDSPVGRLLRPPAQLVLSGVLGAGNERVYAGRGGWLFYRPDVEYVTGRGFLDPGQMARRTSAAGELDTPPQPDPRPAIRRFHRDLAARGITLVVMPTPVKPSIHPDRLSSRFEAASRRPRPAGAVPAPSPLPDAAGGPLDLSSSPLAPAPVQNPSYAAFIEGLRGEGVLVFEPSVHIPAAHGDSVPSYLLADTHWRPETMQRVAEALAAFIEAHAGLPPVPAAGYRVEPREARNIGDIAAMLDLPAGQTLFAPEIVPLRFVVGPDGDPWRSSRDADVLVLGDSFSNIYSLQTMGWGEAAGFIEQLSYLLQRPVDRIVQNDEGARATRALLAREVGGRQDRLAGKRVVVWQFAARELAFGNWEVLVLR